MRAVAARLLQLPPPPLLLLLTVGATVKTTPEVTAAKKEIHLAGIFPISGVEGWQGGQVSHTAPVILKVERTNCKVSRANLVTNLK